MERKSNTGLIVLVVILLLVCLGLGGYIAYDKLDNKDNETKKEDKNTIQNVEIEEEKETVATNNEVQMLRTAIGNIIISKDGEVYYWKNTNIYTPEGGMTAPLNFKDESVLGTQGTYSVEGFNAHPNDNTFEGYKLDLSNINSAYTFTVGNGGVATAIYFVSKDGKISSLNVSMEGDPNNPLNIRLDKDICSKDNIVSVVQTHSTDVLFIDNLGNKYKLADVLK